MFSHPGRQLISLRSHVKIIKKKKEMRRKRKMNFFQKTFIFTKMFVIWLRNNDSLNRIMK
ncbi:MAG: hypothetical protein FMNOHCHN_03155 [Ignavibacteriaceae bacterium]|nr:hypothetical protein [Ignavibacteriaceae bacterium]